MSHQDHIFQICQSQFISVILIHSCYSIPILLDFYLFRCLSFDLRHFYSITMGEFIHVNIAPLLSSGQNTATVERVDDGVASQFPSPDNDNVVNKRKSALESWKSHRERKSEFPRVTASVRQSSRDLMTLESVKQKNRLKKFALIGENSHWHITSAMERISVLR